MPYDRRIFFDEVRERLFNNRLTQENVDGIDSLLDYMELREWDDGQVYLRRWLSYLFATSFHETAFRMVPIEEYGSQSYLRGKPYYPYYGRGHVQLTWESNYRHATQQIVDRELLSNGALLTNGEWCDLVPKPEQALDMEVSCAVIYTGMWEGWFTGKKLYDYLTDGKRDYVGARRIINGTDRASTIAGYAERFEDCFDAAWMTEAAAAPPPTPIEPAADKPDERGTYGTGRPTLPHREVG